MELVSARDEFQPKQTLHDAEIEALRKERDVLIEVLKNQQLLRTSLLSRLTSSREERDILCAHQPSIQGLRKDHRTTNSPFQGHKILKIIEHLIWSSTETEIVPFQWNSSLLETSSSQFFSFPFQSLLSPVPFQWNSSLPETSSS
uniref:Uncharacterized protein n=1 Tax=Fagus sylvatica TaxID=28930 RepID=A0A2N9IMI5_FAGSY